MLSSASRGGVIGVSRRWRRVVVDHQKVVAVEDVEILDDLLVFAAGAEELDLIGGCDGFGHWFFLVGDGGWIFEKWA